MRTRGLARLLAPVTLFALALASSVSAATITIINNDGPGEGYNDITAAAPVGGNPGMTIGAQRPMRCNTRPTSGKHPAAPSRSASTHSSGSPARRPRVLATSFYVGGTSRRSVAAIAHQALANRLQARTSTWSTTTSAHGQLQHRRGHACRVAGTAVDAIRNTAETAVDRAARSARPRVQRRPAAPPAPTSVALSIYDYYLLDNSIGLHWDQMTRTTPGFRRGVQPAGVGASDRPGGAYRRQAGVAVVPAPIAGLRCRHRSYGSPLTAAPITQTWW
jgi:hypothetical protein